MNKTHLVDSVRHAFVILILRIHLIICIILLPILIIRQWKLQGYPRQRDENALSVDLGPLKNLHQRNKSMSALNTSAALKGVTANPIRRAAFADISNKGKPSNVQDDLIVKSSKISTLEVKPLRPVQRDALAPVVNQAQHPELLKAKSLLRPAQRPLTAATQKALPAEPVNSNVVAASSLNPESTATDSTQPRRTIVKRHTTIFRETTSNASALSESKHLPSVASLLPLSSILSTVEPRVTSSTSAVSSRATTISPVEPHDIPLPPATASEDFTSFQQVPHSLSTLPAPSATEPSLLTQPIIEPELYLPALESQIPEPALTLPEEELVFKQPIVEIAPIKQTIVDVEEYWDDEEEEFFDAEGCITARSIRSAGGDNTTGGVSVVLNPRVNARVERELAAAKAWVDENITAEDVEDEAWDTTMVAEYGDEIFTYMRELEVGTTMLTLKPHV
jgi:G2/mitotic-specific cyclin 3/4